MHSNPKDVEKMRYAQIKEFMNDPAVEKVF